MSPPTGYSRLQVFLHWLVAGLIAAAFLTHDDMGRALRDRIEQDLSGLEGATLHTILGGLAFVFILWRIVVRWLRGVPSPDGSSAQRTAAVWGHRLLYLLMVVVPLGGAIAWYGKSREVGEVHEIGGKALVVLAIGHAAVAIWHGIFQKDGTLKRMIRPE